MSLVEVIVSAALILLLATLFITAMVSGEEGAITSGTRTRAGFLAEEGLEAARNIRDESFANLIDGSYGIGQSGGTWALVGASDTQDIFTRTVSIQTISAISKSATSTVTWQQNGQRAGSVSVNTRLTDLGVLAPQAKSLQVDISGGHISNDVKFVGLKIKNVGANPITLSSTTIAWTGGSGTYFNQININGGTVWSSSGPGYPAGNQVSSSTVGMTPTLMQPNSQTPFNAITFDQSMHGASFTIVFIMSDNSSTTITTATMP